MQKALFDWITLATPRIPQLALAFHPANGGYRNPIEARRLKGLGVRAGVPDVMIPATQVGGAGYAGLAIELKAGKNTNSEAQDGWAYKLLRYGNWYVRTCYSFDEARQTIADYFGVKP